ncbi:conserved hypothetical protein [Perkinsus marinus ATCC 50983]|uniref:Uncharacterized protein n=1 Tax=Perkinsus marinus (strain ATCC 50983 / TXsc) TaxID=423536 RepID=C5K4H1_PERM5|nr:conserved hypothetical protein [Perkinsus marinus ATCC 50983]XP_002772877.1 conserved hypothetical protein [Perkinsus marinus ATCC 50983]XP_002788868.1 conserved hypothetical protein [Perkinsus marinus ATCC 50983]EER01943.1 conserved hypothetical protein [Perkinsus marinus ATCC 50983]EER04693.1 conserved hypothetical protein [Perkinsus marinus ATCC 50983]EER20664.1 conserved hypothetical protein [Perkinsus marinus ATCC 50983]|eukprot:XP_002769225.1 conserved hypothetical protein [Perkinsus marinus ATCC 50983]
MKFIAAVASAVIAVSLTGCSSDDSTTTAAPAATTVAPKATTIAPQATTKFMEPTTPSEVVTTTSSNNEQQTTTASSEQTTPAQSQQTTTTPSQTTAGSPSSSCKKPEGEYCGSAMGMPASVELHDNSFDLDVAGMINAKNIGYTMESDCTTVEPDWNNADLIKLAESLGMNTKQLSEFMKCSYNANTNVFKVSMAGALNLDLSPDQCKN